MNERPSLTTNEMAPLWDAIRSRIERTGQTTGRLKLPPLSAGARLTVAVMCGGGRATATIDLAVLERELDRLGMGPGLRNSLAQVGHPVSPEPERRRAGRQAATHTRAAFRAAAARWPEPWAGEWADQVLASGAIRGLDTDAALAIVVNVRRLLDALADRAPSLMSRVDLAAQIFGDAHALDHGTRLDAAASRALVLEHGAAVRAQAWEQAGVQRDLTSAPVLTWRLPVSSAHGLGGLVGAANSQYLPIHLSQFALRHAVLPITAEADVLVVENPRVVEAAAQRHYAGTVIATNGNPSTAVQLLLQQLLDAGCHLRYHGDFDCAGLAIAGRLQRIGLHPWRMTSGDYQAAVDRADGVELPIDDRSVPPTPWDPPLRDVFAATRRVVHQERLIDDLLVPVEPEPTTTR